MKKNMSVGQRIAALRKSRGLDQSEFGEAIGVSRGVIAKWEIDERNIKADTVVKIAEFFDVSCDYVLTGVEARHLDIYKDLRLSESVIERLENDCDGDNSFAYLLNSLMEYDADKTVKILSLVYRFWNLNE